MDFVTTRGPRIVGIFGTIGTGLYAVRSWMTGHWAEDQFAITLAALIFALSALILGIRSRGGRNINGVDETTAAKIQWAFKTYSAKNAQCDLNLFDLLNEIILVDFGKVIADARTAIGNAGDDEAVLDELEKLALKGGELTAQRRLAISVALNEIKTNIRDCVESASQVVSAHAGEKSCACLKHIEAAEGTLPDDLADLRLATEFRCSTSLQKRVLNPKETFRISDNTITEQIMLNAGEERRFWGSDNLASLPDYRNARGDDAWKRFYNATMGVGVLARPLPDEPPSKIRFWSVLCVDNFGGGLDNDLCKGYLAEVADRLSIMQYRQYRLQRVMPK